MRFALDAFDHREEDLTWDGLSFAETPPPDDLTSALPNGDVDFAAFSSATSLATEVLLDTWADTITNWKQQCGAWVAGSLSEMAVSISPSLRNLHSDKHLNGIEFCAGDALSNMTVLIPPDTNPSDVPTPDEMDDPDDAAPHWIHSLWSHLYIPQFEMTLPFNREIVTVYSWYLDHVRHRECHEPRVLHLDDQWQDWETQMRRRWQDLVDDRQPLSVHLVYPEPPRGDGEEHQGHVLITQSITEEVSVSLTAIQEDRDGYKRAWRCATVLPGVINRQNVLGKIPEVIFTSSPATWVIADHAVLSQEPHGISHGISLVAIHSLRQATSVEEVDDVATLLAHQPQLHDPAPPLLQYPGVARDIANPEDDPDDDLSSLDGDDPVNWQQASLMTLGRAPILARVRWHDFERMAADCAEHLGWDIELHSTRSQNIPSCAIDYSTL